MINSERLPATHPELAGEWSERNEYPPENYSYGCRDKVWWKCRTCGGEWQAKISNRSRGGGCPYCHAGSTAVLPGFNDLASQFPAIAAEWSEKNLPLTPDRVRYGSNRMVWWKCKNGHEWQAAVTWRVHGNNCPVCANRVVLKGDNDFATHYPELAKEWSERNPVSPDSVAYGYYKAVWWTCPDCGNEYLKNPRLRIKGSRCPICTGKEVRRGINDLASRYPEIAAEWDHKRNRKHTRLTPETVWEKSNSLAWWICPLGHSWRGRVRERTEEGKVCAECEAVFNARLPVFLTAAALKKNRMKLIPGYEIKTGIRLELYVPELSLAVEAECVSEEGRREQADKEKLCTELGIRYIVLRAGSNRTETAAITKKILKENGSNARCTEEMVPELWNEYQAAINGMRKEGKNE